MLTFTKFVSCALAVAALAACAAPARQGTLTGDYLAGRLAEGVNDVQAAADAYGAAAKAGPADEELLRDAFFYHLAAGEIEESLPYARRLTNADAPDALAQITFAVVNIKHRDYAAARKFVETDFTEPYAKTIAFLLDAWAIYAANGADAGIAALDAGGADIFQGFVPLFKALIYETKAENEAARQAHELSIYSYGGPVGREAYGAFLERSGDAAAAREFYALLDRDPGPSRRVAQAGLARLDRGEMSSAYAGITADEGAAIALYLFAGNLLEQSAEQRKRAADAGFNVGLPKYNFPLALAQLAIYLDPESADARRLVSGIMNVYGNYEQARQVLMPIAPSSPHYEQARIEIAAGLVEQGREEEAAKVLKEAIKLDPNADEARLTYAGLLAREHQYEDAIGVLSDVIDALGETPREDAWRFYISRAASLMEIDKWPAAERDLERAVEIAPEEATTLNYLGYSWAERGENLERAFQLIEKAVELEPSSGAIIDSLGWAHYQLGEYDEALGHLEQAAALEPADPTITDHLGDVYWRLGRQREARYQWRRALELKPVDRVREQIEDKLENGLPAVGASGD